MKKTGLKTALKNNSLQEGLLFLILSVSLIIYSFCKYHSGFKIEWKMSPYLFPIFLGIIGTILSLSLIVEGCTQIKKSSVDEKELEYFNAKNFIALLALAILYYICLKKVPFIISTTVFLAVLMWIFNERRWWMIALVSIITTVVLYLIFAVGLHVNLP